MGPDLIGREEELAALSLVLDPVGPSRGVVLSGPAGVGKTVLLRAAVAEAETRRFVVLSALSSSAESRLSYAGLADLVGGVLDDVLDDLPSPQSTALQVALLRSGGEVVDARTVCAALLSVLRCLAARSPVLVSVDDLQWMDTASARALAFAFRRLREEAVVLVAARRVGDPVAGQIERDWRRRRRHGGSVERLPAAHVWHGADNKLTAFWDCPADQVVIDDLFRP